MERRVIKDGEIQMLDLTSDEILIGKKLYLQKKLKSCERELKKSIKSNDRFNITKYKGLIFDIDEQLKELENE